MTTQKKRSWRSFSSGNRKEFTNSDRREYTSRLVKTRKWKYVSAEDSCWFLSSSKSSAKWKRQSLTVITWLSGSITSFKCRTSARIWPPTKMRPFPLTHHKLWEETLRVKAHSRTRSKHLWRVNQNNCSSRRSRRMRNKHQEQTEIRMIWST